MTNDDQTDFRECYVTYTFHAMFDTYFFVSDPLMPLHKKVTHLLDFYLAPHLLGKQKPPANKRDPRGLHAEASRDSLGHSSVSDGSLFEPSSESIGAK